MAGLDTDIRSIKGIGEARAKVLEKLHIHTLGDLLSYYPRRWEDRTRLWDIRSLPEGEYACCKAMLASDPTASRIPGRRRVVKARAVDSTGVLDVTFFNQEYRQSSLHQGETYIFYGKVEGHGLRRRMVNPILEQEGRQQLTGRIMPVYPLTAGLTQTVMAKAVAQGLEACRHQPPEDVLPPALRQQYDLCDAAFARENIHFPDSPSSLESARRRLVFEELFLLGCGLTWLRQRRGTTPGPPCENHPMTPFYGALPFPLTGAQRRAVEDCTADMTSGRMMNRLCQGDVGSGKTMVAAACVWFAAQSGWQSALMVPTEILARQHYETLSPLFSRLGLRCGLLTGSTPAPQRRQLLEELARGDIHLCIGTHALLTADVVYHRLGLVITDEQHRFGVEQRAALSQKGSCPHLLVLSATPIPRTLALIVYGDLDVSVIDELPPGRQKVDTFLLGEPYRQRLNGFIRKQAQAGHQVFIVCPLVGEEDTVVDERKAVTAYAAMLQRETFPDLRVSVLHGRMKPKEKEQAMAAFAAGESDILVSTTVVEVGVDVPNATLMVVENADRFGLSQLHQLRGRVGRGTAQSWCVLLSDTQNPDTRRRLKALTATNDGFRIAEEDLSLRGPGDFFGSRQHGLPELKAASLTCDAALLAEASDAARQLLADDPALTANAPLCRRVEQLFQTAEGTLN